MLKSDRYYRFLAARRWPEEEETKITGFIDYSFNRPA